MQCILIIWWDIVDGWSMSWGHEDDLNHTGYPLEHHFVLFISGHRWFLMRPQFRVRKKYCRCLKLLKLGFNNIHSIHYFVAPILLCCQSVRSRYRYWLIWTLLTPCSTVLGCLGLKHHSFLLELLRNVTIWVLTFLLQRWRGCLKCKDRNEWLDSPNFWRSQNKKIQGKKS